jgi:hypothetical protein
MFIIYVKNNENVGSMRRIRGCSHNKTSQKGCQMGPKNN